MKFITVNTIISYYISILHNITIMIIIEHLKTYLKVQH